MKVTNESKRISQSSMDNNNISSENGIKIQDLKTKWKPRRGNHYVIIEW